MARRPPWLPSAARARARPRCCAGSLTCRPRSSCPWPAGTGSPVPAEEVRALGPAHGPVVVKQPVSAGQLDLELGDLLVQPGEHQLGRRALRAGLARGQLLAQPDPRQPGHLGIGPQPQQPVMQAGRAQLRAAPARSGRPRRSCRPPWASRCRRSRPARSSASPSTPSSPGRPSPIRSASGILASVRKTSLNSASPVICRSGRTSTPGCFMSSAK